MRVQEVTERREGGPAGLVETSAAPVATGSPSTVPVPQFPLVSEDPWANGVLVTLQSPELVPPAESPRPMGYYGIVTHESRPCPS